MAEPQKFWSVTTLIKQGLGTGGGLVWYGKKEVAKVCFERYEMYGAFVRADDRIGAFKWAIQKEREALKGAAARGTDLHKIAEKWALGQEVGEIRPEIQPFADQYLSFLNAFRPTFLMAEAPIYNVTHSYAGTCDGVIELGGERLLYDIKTTAWGPGAIDPDTGNEKTRPPYTDVALQLAAYRRAELVGVMSEKRTTGWGDRYYVFDPDAHHEPMPEVDGALCVVVSPEDCLAFTIKTGEEVWRAFRVAMEAARWQTWTSRAAIGNPISPPVEVAV